MIEVKQVKMACLSAVAVAALAGCASQGDLKASVAPVDAGRYGLVETKAEAPQSLVDSEAWWARLGDPALTALIDEALSAHPDMQAASARVRLGGIWLGVLHLALHWGLRSPMRV